VHITDKVRLKRTELGLGMCRKLCSSFHPNSVYIRARSTILDPPLELAASSKKPVGLYATPTPHRLTQMHGPFLPEVVVRSPLEAPEGDQGGNGGSAARRRRDAAVSDFLVT
jgi:hypothetical protein